MPSKANKSKRKVLVVDDHPVVRGGLRQLIDQEPDLKVCGEAEDASEALKAIDALDPDLAIVDITLGKVSGLKLVKMIKGRYSELPILVLSMHDENLYAERVLRAGAKGYIGKQEAAKKVLTAIRRVLNDEIYLSEKMTAKVLDHFAAGSSTKGSSPLGQLSDRELEVFELIGNGLGTRQIAERLNLSIKTVDVHRQRIKEKLKLKGTSELLQRAIHWVNSETRESTQ